MIRTVVLLLASLLARGAAAATVTEVHYLMGTYFSITAEHADAAAARTALRRCFATTRRLESVFSRYDQASELSRLNASAASVPVVAVSDEMAALLRRAIALQAATGGAFDPGVGALTALWRQATVWPSAAQIAGARGKAGAGAFRLDGPTLLRRSGAHLDFDGIAKGWAVDRCVQQLRSDGIRRALLSFGESSLYALGAPRGTAGWKVMVRGLDVRRAAGTLTLRDQAVSVSAVFGHERRIGTRRIGHIVDPRSGGPLTLPAMAVVVASSATDAEAFSKAVLIRGDLPEARQSPITGALLIRSHTMQRSGRIPFRAFGATRPIAASAEPLR